MTEKTQIKAYYIIIENTPPIGQTWGANEDEARERAEKMLDRGGRHGLLRAWRDGGSKLQEKKEATEMKNQSCENCGEQFEGSDTLCEVCREDYSQETLRQQASQNWNNPNLCEMCGDECEELQEYGKDGAMLCEVCLEYLETTDTLDGQNEQANSECATCVTGKACDRREQCVTEMQSACFDAGIGYGG